MTDAEPPPPMMCPFCGAEMRAGRISARGYTTVWEPLERPERGPLIDPFGIRSRGEYQVTPFGSPSIRDASFCDDCHALVIPPEGEWLG